MKILFLANHFHTLFAFRKELITRLCEENHEVYLSLPESEDNKIFEKMGCMILKTPIDRRGMNPVKDMGLILFYKNIMKEVKPDVIFSFTIKPNIYGSLVSNRKYRQICNVTGTGATFLKESLINKICKCLYKLSTKKSYKVFFQNTGDRDYFLKNKMIGTNYEMLPGSGCNLEEYRYVSMLEDNYIRFIFIGRVMKLKGIDEYLEAAQMIKEKYPMTEFLIAGWNEENEYQEKVEEYQKLGIINYIGFRKDISEQIQSAHCTVLPSHGGEGIPNVLLETAATGRACIGSRTNGTVDVIEDNVSGYLFEAGSSMDLANKMEQFINLSNVQKIEMGVAGRAKIEREFDRNIVIERYMKETKINE